MRHTPFKTFTLLFALAGLCSPAISADNGNLDYTVIKGDTIWTFSQVYLNGDEAWKEVVKLNAVKNPKLLQPGTHLLIPVNLLKQERSLATIVSSTGPVNLIPFGQTAHAAKAGETVAYKDRLSTGPQGFASIKLPDGSIISLPSNTEVQVNALAKSAFKNRIESDLSVQQGKVEAIVTRQKQDDRFILRTPQAIAGVRGTEFRFGLGEQNNTLLEVLDGAVALGAPQGKQEQLVRGGELASVDSQGQLSTSSLPTAPRWNIDSSIQVSEQVDLALGDTTMAAPNVHVTVADNTAFDNPRFETRSANPVIHIPDLPDGVWFAKAAYTLPNGAEGEAQTLMIDRLTGKGGKSPSAIQTDPNGRSVTFKWVPLGQAQRYQLRITPSANAPAIQQTTQAPSASVCCLKPGTYVWQVSYFDSSNTLVHESPAQTLLVGPKVSLPSTPKSQ